jgi:hypothetical protein
MVTVMYPVANFAIESAIHGHSERSRNANDEYPNLAAAVSQLATGGPNAQGPPQERARLYTREVVRPLTLQMMLAARGAGAELASR